VGVTVTVAMIGLVPVFVAVKAGISPVPLAAIPIAVFELVHENVPPAGVLVKLEAVTEPLLHTVMPAGTVTLGEGFTVIEYEDGLPEQLFMSGVTVMVAEIGDVPVLVAINEAISPDPLADNPIAVLELVHENVPPAGVLEKFVEGTDTLLHMVMFAGTVTVGVGFTVIV